GNFPPNTFGLYDMHGNVWEWCQDDWHDHYTNAPEDGIAWISQSGDIKVMRGGSWFNSTGDCRSANRGGIERVYGDDLLGFRLAVSPPP
ncbi:MAG: formylglycine-generating enzyme family protein, partial [Dolichospermum sp.]